VTCHICATYQELPRSVTVTHEYSTRPTSSYDNPGHGRSGFPTFQAGVEATAGQPLRDREQLGQAWAACRAASRSAPGVTKTRPIAKIPRCGK
jgi:hypothetical protein